MTDTPSRPGPGRPGTLALVVASASLLLSVVSCGLVALVVARGAGDLLPTQSKPELATASQVEAVAHVTLPPGTVFLAAAYSNGLQTRLSATFRIPRGELDAFLTSGGFTATLTPGRRAITDEHNVGGGNLWRPETAASVSGIVEQQPTTDGTYRSLMLDLDDPATITVYLYATRD